MPNVVILGSGNVASHLSIALYNAGYNILQVFSRNQNSSKELASKTSSQKTDIIEEIFLDADIYFFCMNDTANLEISKTIKLKRNPIIVHTAGSQSISIFSDLSENHGAFYPFQTFTKDVKTDFTKVPICIEASNDKTLNNLKLIADHLGCKSHFIDEKGREILHLTGVFAANFLNHCVSISEEILKENNIDTNIIKPLLEQSFYKILNIGATNSQTGPAIRNDIPTLNKHVNLLKDNEQYSNVYKVLTESIKEWKKKN